MFSRAIRRTGPGERDRDRDQLTPAHAALARVRFGDGRARDASTPSRDAPARAAACNGDRHRASTRGRRGGGCTSSRSAGRGAAGGCCAAPTAVITRRDDRDREDGFHSDAQTVDYLPENLVIFPSNCPRSADADGLRSAPLGARTSSPCVSTPHRLDRGDSRARVGRHGERVGAAVGWRAGVQTKLRVLSHRRVRLSRPSLDALKS